jgi:hypothetical protein
MYFLQEILVVIIGASDKFPSLAQKILAQFFAQCMIERIY